MNKSRIVAPNHKHEIFRGHPRPQTTKQLHADRPVRQQHVVLPGFAIPSQVRKIHGLAGQAEAGGVDWIKIVKYLVPHLWNQGCEVEGTDRGMTLSDTPDDR